MMIGHSITVKHILLITRVGLQLHDHLGASLAGTNPNQKKLELYRTPDGCASGTGPGSLVTDPRNVLAVLFKF